MGILDNIFLSLPCARCHERYEIPLKNIFLARESIHEGCPSPMPRDCPQQYWAQLLDTQVLEKLEEVWKDLEVSAQANGGVLVVRGSPAVPSQSAPVSVQPR